MRCVTGAAGFIGSNFVLDWFSCGDEPVVSLDKLTYAGNRANLASLDGDDRHVFVRGDIGDKEGVASLLQKYRPRAILNFAAETHVDRSISGPEVFAQTNVIGTFRLLEATLDYWKKLPKTEQTAFRFVQISTDEVFGALDCDEPPFEETSPFLPNSPYAASKASADHFVRAFGKTYGLPTLVTHCSNNYGPRHFPEKLIPLVICNALKGEALPIYGTGQNIRDWVYVSDHCAALRAVLQKGQVGEHYNIGGGQEVTNIDLVTMLCENLDVMRPRADGRSYKEQIEFVPDRPGHDFRYAINAAKVQSETGWTPQETLKTGLSKTVAWYLENQTWVESVTSGTYRQWMTSQYGKVA